jgi:hypothetical protein
MKFTQSEVTTKAYNTESIYMAPPLPSIQVLGGGKSSADEMHPTLSFLLEKTMDPIVAPLDPVLPPWLIKQENAADEAMQAFRIKKAEVFLTEIDDPEMRFRNGIAIMVPEGFKLVRVQFVVAAA